MRGINIYQLKIKRVGLSDTTINIRLRTLKAIFNQLERDELIEINPTSKLKLLRQDIDLTNCLTDEEVIAILAQPNRRDFVGFRDYVAICLMLDSGCRISEMLGLRTGDIDFQTRFISLSGGQNINRKPQMFPISAEVTKLLLQLIEENRAGMRDYALILLTLDTGIRPSEVLALQPNDFNLISGWIRVPDKVAKTRVSRTLNISPVTVDALKHFVRMRPRSWVNKVQVFSTESGNHLNRHTWGIDLSDIAKK
ncbi:site-specific integrase [Paenibacillus faecalis]|uniref:site-specific integrase n=1 Tax=Paenibacillus faecalis TaxID=2079532 RepID=UPI000D103F82|nr:site-specific integrase [Paenibacillus faecalis]